VMSDDVAQKLGADIILPESCVKPSTNNPRDSWTSSIGADRRSRLEPTGDR